MERETTIAAPSPPVHVRLRSGLRRGHNWVQLVRFCLVGGSGYFVNVTSFAVLVSLVGVHHLLAAAVAFVLAVTNNFWWNRHWTFGARAGLVRMQAPRFIAVSVAAFILQVSVLQLLIVAADVPKVAAQAVSILVAVPVNFVGHKMWSFGRSLARF